jgi:hypothetical protein
MTLRVRDAVAHCASSHAVPFARSIASVVEIESYGSNMAAALAEMKREWRAFKHDRPGRRFQNQRRRMRDGSRALMVAQVALGVLLLAGGVVLLFIPGPGLLLIVFGLALVGGLSRKLSALMDRMEPPIRRQAKRTKAWWDQSTLPTKVVLGAIAVIGAAGFFYAMYRLWFA